MNDAINPADLNAELRHDVFVSDVCEQQQLWLLADGEQYCLLRIDEEECLPVWPSEEQAQAWNSDDSMRAKAVPLTVWLQRWVPGMIAEGSRVAVFPGSAGDAVVVTPQELADSLRAGLAGSTADSEVP